MVSMSGKMLAGGCLVVSVVFGAVANAWSETKAKRGDAKGEITVNGAVISQAQRTALEQAYGPVQPGRYWYDKVSGLWGQAGMTTIGQIMPGLDLGGPLKSDASHGNTKVFLNGRELTQVEVQTLQQLGPSIPVAIGSTRRVSAGLKAAHHSLTSRRSSRNETRNIIARPLVGISGAMRTVTTGSIPRPAAVS